MDSLQFQKAEFVDPRPQCVACKTPIDSEYFHAGGRVVCPLCAGKVRDAQQKPSASAVMRGLMYGGGAAVACAVGYAILTAVLNMEFAIAAIVVGYVVGRAVRIGSRGLGGRRCQVLAVLLTYFAITISYVPLLVRQMKEQAKIAETKKAQTQSGGAPTAQTTPRRASAAGFAVAYLFVAALALLAPVLGLAAGLNGVIGIVIILVGLAQAWRQTARDKRLLMGPYVWEGPSAGSPAEGSSSIA